MISSIVGTIMKSVGVIGGVEEGEEAVVANAGVGAGANVVHPSESTEDDTRTDNPPQIITANSNKRPLSATEEDSPREHDLNSPPQPPPQQQGEPVMKKRVISDFGQQQQPSRQGPQDAQQQQHGTTETTTEVRLVSSVSSGKLPASKVAGSDSNKDQQDDTPPPVCQFTTPGVVVDDGEDDDGATSSSGSGDEESVQENIPPNSPSATATVPVVVGPPASIEINVQKKNGDNPDPRDTEESVGGAKGGTLVADGADDRVGTVADEKGEAVSISPQQKQQQQQQTLNMESPVNLPQTERRQSSSRAEANQQDQGLTAPTSPQHDQGKRQQEPASNLQGHAQHETSGNLQGLHKYDVLCYQLENSSFGCFVLDHPGNINFRKLVSRNMLQFKNCKTREERTVLCEHVVAFIENLGGKFRAKDRPPAVTATTATTIMNTYNKCVPRSQAISLTWRALFGAQGDIFTSKFEEKRAPLNITTTTQPTTMTGNTTVTRKRVLPQSQEETISRKAFRPPQKASVPPDPSQVIDLLDDSDEDEPQQSHPTQHDSPTTDHHKTQQAGYTMGYSASQHIPQKQPRTSATSHCTYEYQPQPHQNVSPIQTNLPHAPQHRRHHAYQQQQQQQQQQLGMSETVEAILLGDHPIPPDSDSVDPNEQFNAYIATKKANPPRWARVNREMAIEKIKRNAAVPNSVPLPFHGIISPMPLVGDGSLLREEPLIYIDASLFDQRQVAAHRNQH